MSLTAPSKLQGCFICSSSVLLLISLCILSLKEENRMKHINPEMEILLKPTSSADLNEVFISVKTTGANHKTRLGLILETWFTLAKEQTWFFTDMQDKLTNETAIGHLTVTPCTPSHSPESLCCKMASEFEAYLKSGKRWWCHFDDDNYVNIPTLLHKLGSFDPFQDWYLGKPSHPKGFKMRLTNVTTWFGTGGAGFCISKSLTTKMAPLARDGKFTSLGSELKMPDDVTIGFLINNLLHTNITIVEEFHSHLEPMFKLQNLRSQISFSYANDSRSEANVKVVVPGNNVINITSGFDSMEDPTRFKSVHCELFPHVRWCPKGETSFKDF